MESDVSDIVGVAVEDDVEEKGCAEERSESDEDVPPEDDGTEDAEVDESVEVEVEVEVDVEVAKEEGSEEEYVENVGVKAGIDEAGKDVEDVKGSLSEDAVLKEETGAGDVE